MKKRCLLTFLSFLLLITVIASQTAITKVIRTASAETISAGTTQNNKIKYVDSSGNALSSVEINKIHTFLNLLKTTKGCVVYANEIARTNHIEGNIIVNNVNVPTSLVITRVKDLNPDVYSYVGNTTASIQLSDNGKIFLGSKIQITKPNGNQSIINGGYSNNISAISLSGEDTKKNEKMILNTLANISKTGSTIKSIADTSFFGNSTNSFQSVNSLLENGVVSKGDVISININYNEILNNEGSFGNLINSNPGVTVIVNVIFPSSAPKDININKAFSSNVKIPTEFNPKSSYIIWNFGDFAGNITINEEMLGIIVAPNANVYQAAGNLNGQIISNIAGNNGELHQVTFREEEKEEEKTTPEETTPSESESSSPEETTPSETESTSIEETTPSETESTSIEETTPAESESTSIEETTPAESESISKEETTPSKTESVSREETTKATEKESETQTLSQTTEFSSEEETTVTPTKPSSPSTGDNSIAYFLMFLLIASVIVGLISYAGFKKNDNK